MTPTDLQLADGHPETFGMQQASAVSLFDPVTIGDLRLKNRVVMAPLTRSRADASSIPPKFAADYYGQRAGAGLIVSEATNISSRAGGYAFTPGIWSAEQVEAWRRIVAAVHRNDGIFFLQLWHSGRISHPDLHGGALPPAPSALRPAGQAFTFHGMQDYVMPRALGIEEIEGIVQDYRLACVAAQTAGFDGVEVHSGNNFLLEQFIRDSSNRRNDEYGGSIDNRLRFPLAVVRAAVDVWGSSRVGIRISPATTFAGQTPLDSRTMDTYGTYVSALSDLGLAYIHVVEGVTRQTRVVPDDVSFPALRQLFHGPYIANNGYTQDMAQRAIAAGEIDMVSFGRRYLANPDLVDRLRSGGPLADAPEQYWYGGGANGYSDWPTL